MRVELCSEDLEKGHLVTEFGARIPVDLTGLTSPEHVRRMVAALRDEIERIVIGRLIIK